MALTEKHYVKSTILCIVAGSTVKHSTMAGHPWYLLRPLDVHDQSRRVQIHFSILGNLQYVSLLRDVQCNITGNSCKMTASVWVIKVLYSFFLNLGGVKFHRHTNSVCSKKCLRKVFLCCLRAMKVRKRLILHLNTNKVEEANKKDKLSIKQIVAKFNVCKTQVYEVLKKKSELKEHKIIWGKYMLIV